MRRLASGSPRSTLPCCQHPVWRHLVSRSRPCTLDAYEGLCYCHLAYEARGSRRILPTFTGYTPVDLFPNGDKETTPVERLLK